MLKDSEKLIEKQQKEEERRVVDQRAYKLEIQDNRYGTAFLDLLFLIIIFKELNSFSQFSLLNYFRSRKNKEMKMALALQYEQNIKDKQQKLMDEKMYNTKIDNEHLDIGAQLGINDCINEQHRRQMQRQYLNGTTETDPTNVDINSDNLSRYQKFDIVRNAAQFI